MLLMSEKEASVYVHGLSHRRHVIVSDTSSDELREFAKQAPFKVTLLTDQGRQFIPVSRRQLATSKLGIRSVNWSEIEAAWRSVEVAKMNDELAEQIEALPEGEGDEMLIRLQDRLVERRSSC